MFSSLLHSTVTASCRLRLIASNRLDVAVISVKGFAPTVVGGMTRSATITVRLRQQ